MTRPSVSVVVPFAGDPAAGRQALEMLRALHARDGDQLILSDNSGTFRPEATEGTPGIAVEPVIIRADRERSPAHARNAGAAHATGEFILFLDADTRPPADLLDRYFRLPVGDRVGALAGEIRPAPDAGQSLATRYAARRNFLSQRAHLAHPFRPRAAAANLLVRRSAFEAAGGFREGLRAAEDTDFCWRLQALGWTLELREDAAVEHVYRTTIRELRAQWRGYAAGRAWLARNYPGFRPEPAARRALRRARGAAAGAGLRAGPSASTVPQNRLERAEFLALDAVLAVEELIGLRLGNHPGPATGGGAEPASADAYGARAPTRRIRVDLVDPSAYTPPYDHALAAALAHAGASVRLITSEFAYGSVPAPDGYAVLRRFYRHAAGAAGSRLRLLSKLVEHVPDMLGYRRLAREADVVHFQWTTVQALDRFLLPHGPVVLTAHDLLPREPRPGQLRAQRALYERVDAVVVHSEHGRRTLVDGLGVAPAKVHVIHHGAFEHLTRQPREDPLPVELQAVDGPVVLFFGLLRAYKGIDVLLDAWRGVSEGELWIVGLPRMDIAALRAGAPERVRFVARFVSDAELPAFFRRADIVTLPYTSTERQDQSGVLATALAFGRPIVLSDVGGFAEVAASGAASLVAPGDPESLRAELRRLIADPAERERLAAAARSAAVGLYSWDAAARATLALYEALCGRIPPA